MSVPVESAKSPPVTEVLTAFFKRLEGIDAIIRLVVSNARITALMIFRGEPEKRLILNLIKPQLEVDLNDAAKDGIIHICIPGERMHEILQNKLDPGVSLARRELLLRGNPFHFSKFIPLFEFGPMLYKEHLADMRLDGQGRKSGYSPIKESDMDTPVFEGKAIPVIQLSFFEKALFGIINALAYVLGFVMGVIRYRLFENLSLFDVLNSMSKGLSASSPNEENQAIGNGSTDG